MKKFILCVIFVLVAVCVRSQDFTLLHINAKWNQSNNFNLRGIKNAKIQFALLEDQSPSIRSQIKAVPVIILLDKNGKPRGKWTADLSFKITVTKDEIQQRINSVMMQSSSRRRATTN
tara:strand:- start:2740 stop:3093 length:354 start_codon:yes stop_codon:yes gene_type:complete